MQQYLIDTNYLLRFLLKDVPSQAKIVREYLVLAEKGKISVTVPLLVFVEIDYALRKLYSFSKNKVIGKIILIVENPFLDIEKRELIHEAIKLYSRKNISFVDAVFCSQARLEGKEFLTFDRRLKDLKIKS